MSADPLDPNTPVNALVIEGMQAEGNGQPDTAHDRYLRAWDARASDLDAAIAAHYVARHQDSPAQALEWNQRALEHTVRCDPDATAGWMPSLHLNLGKSYEDLGDREAAIEHYRLADAASSALPADGYGTMIRSGIARGIERLTQPTDPTSR